MTDRYVRAYVRWREALPDLSAMDPDDAWWIFRDAHEGRCGCCREPDNELLIDHDHTTGYVRALLCRGCNFHADSGGSHRRLTSYTSPLIPLYCQYPPAAAAGLCRVYEDMMGGPAASKLDWIIWTAGAAGIEHWHSRERTMSRTKAMFDAIGL